MAFNYLNFQRWSLAFDNGAQAEWQYSSVDDNLATIMSAGYFNPVNGGTASHNMIVNDIIYIVGTDGFLWIGVTAINPDITTAALPANITPGSITTADLADGAVTNPKLAVNAVDTNNVIDGSITNAKLATPGGGGPQLTLQPVKACTYVSGDLGGIYDNGVAGVGATITNAGAQAALVIEGYAVQVNDRILVAQQNNIQENGIFVCNDQGSVSTNWIIERSSDYNTPAQILQGTNAYVFYGGANCGQFTFLMNQPSVTTIGTDPIYYEISSAGSSNTGQPNGVFQSFNDGTDPNYNYITQLSLPAIPDYFSVSTVFQSGSSNPTYYYATVPTFETLSCALDTTLATGTLYFVPIPFTTAGLSLGLGHQGLFLPVPLIGNNLCLGIYANSDGNTIDPIPFGAPLYNSSNIPMTSSDVRWNTLASIQIPTILWFAYTIDGGSPSFYCNNAISGIGSQVCLYYGPLSGVGPVEAVTGFNMPFSYSTSLPTITDKSMLTSTLQSNTAGNLLVYVST